MTGLLWRFPELAVLALLVAGSLRVPQLIPVAVLAAGWMCVQEVRVVRRRHKTPAPAVGELEAAEEWRA